VYKAALCAFVLDVEMARPHGKEDYSACVVYIASWDVRARGGRAV